MKFVASHKKKIVMIRLAKKMKLRRRTNRACVAGQNWWLHMGEKI